MFISMSDIQNITKYLTNKLKQIKFVLDLCETFYKFDISANK